ncbi:MAG: 30S ribosomal protein S27e [Thermoplasmata archaeon]|nr:30S ribosomal protein S27e [Thermoplasmata archaeon]
MEGKKLYKPTKIDKKFVKIKCPDCGNEEITYVRGSTEVRCSVCGSTLAIPTGGKILIKGEITGTFE